MSSATAVVRGSVTWPERRIIDRPGRALEALQVLHEVALLAGRQMQAEAAVVVVDDIQQGLEAAIVEEATLGPRPETLELRRGVGVVGSAVGLEGVDADLRWRVLVVAGVGELRRHVAARARALTIEYRLPAPRGGRVE